MRERWNHFWFGWMSDADRRSDVSAVRHLGEDEDGRILMPSKTRPWVGYQWWGPTEFDPRNPLHWPAWLRSRRAHSLAFVEAVPNA